MATKRYPLARVNYGRDEIAAVTACLEAGRTTMGPCVEQFEHEFAAYVGAEHAVMVNSGSSADLLAAFSLGPPGDYHGRNEVLVPAVTWPTQVWACVLAGYRVRLVDVDPQTLQMDVWGIKNRVLRDSARAIFLTHLLGNVTPPNGFGAVTLLEDCCEALGARWQDRHAGTFGQAGTFSFFFSHLLTTMEGGMVVTNDGEVAYRLRLWRAHGWEPTTDEHFRFPTWGMNLRPAEVQGAFGIVQLARLDDFIAARQRNYARLSEAIGAWPGVLRLVTVPVRVIPSWHAFPLLLTPDAPFTKQALCAFLEARGIETRPIVAGNLARQPAVAHHPQIVYEALPGADAIHERGFYIGLSSQDDEEGTAFVGDVLASFMEQHA